MGFRRYKATVTYLSSALKLQSSTVVVELISSTPVTVADPALLNALRALPANSTITSVALSEAA